MFNFIVTTEAGLKFEASIFGKNIADAIKRLNAMTDNASFVRAA